MTGSKDGSANAESRKRRSQSGPRPDIVDQFTLPRRKLLAKLDSSFLLYFNSNRIFCEKSVVRSEKAAIETVAGSREKEAAAGKKYQSPGAGGRSPLSVHPPVRHTNQSLWNESSLGTKCTNRRGAPLSFPPESDLRSDMKEIKSRFGHIVVEIL